MVVHGTRPGIVLASTKNDLDQFLEAPHATLGRVPKTARHATLASGGTYHVALSFGPVDHAQIRGLTRKSDTYEVNTGRWTLKVQGDGYSHEKLSALSKQLRERVPFDRIFGPRDANGDDALVGLANGRRRPFEYRPEELPPSLEDVRMEPLLDAVWDYVDARRVLVSIDAELAYLATPSNVGFRDVGTTLAEAVLGPRRLKPSRR